MKSLLLLLSFLITAFTNAQTHRFFYSANFLADNVTDKYENDVVILDVNPDNTKSYSEEYLIIDSINIAKGSENVKMAHPKFKKIIKKSFDAEDFKNFEFIQSKYYVFETKDEMTWQISSEKDKLGIYNIQKAETDFGGRHWIAWFSPDIPFPFGPYKFGGLPGLILKIADNKNEYVFSLIKNKNYPETQSTERFVENFTFYDTYKPIEISEKQFVKLKIDYFSDPYKELKSGQDDIVLEDENGEKPNFQKLTKDLQSKILSDNNPIEIAKAVKYSQD